MTILSIEYSFVKLLNRWQNAKKEQFFFNKIFKKANLVVMAKQCFTNNKNKWTIPCKNFIFVLAWYLEPLVFLLLLKNGNHILRVCAASIFVGSIWNIFILLELVFSLLQFLLFFPEYKQRSSFRVFWLSLSKPKIFFWSKIDGGNGEKINNVRIQRKTSLFWSFWTPLYTIFSL